MKYAIGTKVMIIKRNPGNNTGMLIKDIGQVGVIAELFDGKYCVWDNGEKKGSGYYGIFSDEEIEPVKEHWVQDIADAFNKATREENTSLTLEKLSKMYDAARLLESSLKEFEEDEEVKRL